MKFIETSLKGAFVIEIEPILDHRGFFTRSWCEKEFRDYGLNIQENLQKYEKRSLLKTLQDQIKRVISAYCN